MVDRNSRTQTSDVAGSQKRFSLVDIVAVIVKWRRFILRVFLVVTILATVVSFLLPRWYASETSIMPPRSRSLLGGLGSVSSLQREIPLLRSIAGAAGSEEVYRYLAILKSRNALEKVVTEFNLVEVYNISDKSIPKAAGVLEDNVIFKLGEEGTISITVYDQDAQRAAAMANYFVDLINEIGTDLNVQETQGDRAFLEKRVEENKADLHASEDRLKDFQKRHGFVAIPEEAQTSISSAAELYATKTMMEVQLGIAERRYGEENPLVQAGKTELAGLNAKLQTLPDLGVEYFRLYRDFAVQQKIYEFIVPLYEQAKYEEKREAPHAVVLDVAQVPEEPARPKKRVIVLILVFLSLISSVGVALFVEGMRNLKTSSPEEYERLQAVWNELRRIWPFAKREH
jgi:tyrosine-protein kinase Etk/Wzc